MSGDAYSCGSIQIDIRLKGASDGKMCRQYTILAPEMPAFDLKGLLEKQLQAIEETGCCTLLSFSQQ
jgi:hypothetical protein